MTLRLGTRGSALALAQSRTVADALAAATGETVEFVEIVTDGDRSTAPVPQLGVGVFVSALREALHAKEIDFAVHSYKDLPTAPAEGLCIAAVPMRDDPRDALITRDGRLLAELGPGTRVGTGAPRRVAQLCALGHGLLPVPVRGNVDTRLRKLFEGEYDALVLATAGLRRLGRAEEITEILDPMLMLPAPAQGALGVECREGEESLVELLGCLDDEHTRAAVTAERSLLAALEAGCSAPVAALAVVAEGEPASSSAEGEPASSSAEGEPASSSAEGEHGGSGELASRTSQHLEIYLRGAVFSPDGQYAVRLSATGMLTDASEVGRRLAADLLADGAETVLGVLHDPHP